MSVHHTDFLWHDHLNSFLNHYFYFQFFNFYLELFCIAHKLVDLYSDQAISWYAVGCYYDLIGKSDPARRYLSKATSIDRLFGPAWLAYGHSFAKENEHDQVSVFLPNFDNMLCVCV